MGGSQEYFFNQWNQVAVIINILYSFQKGVKKM